jgi:[ribosomal protein S18]-alanine N-acetyltransferase
MTVSDLAAAAAIDRACFTGNEARTEAQLREELERTWARVRVARRGPDVLGYALFWHVADEVHLLNVAVAPAARRAGVGRALVEDIGPQRAARVSAVPSSRTSSRTQGVTPP